MNPTNLPELSKPKFPGSHRRKDSKIEISNSKKIDNFNDYFRVSVHDVCCSNAEVDLFDVDPGDTENARF